jgi:hypothetical protein
MNKRNKEGPIDKALEEMANECKSRGENNLAIVLYAYLGSKKVGLDGRYAKHCQDFAKSGLKAIKREQLKKN